MFAENGVVIDMKDGMAKVVGAVEFHNMYVDGSSRGRGDGDRTQGPPHPADEGFVSVFVVMDSSNGRVHLGPEIHARGIAEDDSVFDAIMPDSRRRSKRPPRRARPTTTSCSR